MLLTDNLSAYFGSSGPLANCTFERLQQLASVTYNRYMRSEAADDCEDYRTWKESIYGPAFRDPLPSSSTSDPSATLPTSLPPPVGTSKGKAKTRAKANPVASASLFEGDRVLANRIHFMRATMLYLELCYATAQGDIGRVVEVMKVCSLKQHIISSKYNPDAELGAAVLVLGCGMYQLWQRTTGACGALHEGISR